MDRDTNGDDILESIRMYEELLYELEAKEIQIVIKDITEKRDRLDKKLSKLYENGANPIDDAGTINEMESIIKQADDFLAKAQEELKRKSNIGKSSIAEAVVEDETSNDFGMPTDNENDNDEEQSSTEVDEEENKINNEPVVETETFAYFEIPNDNPNNKELEEENIKEEIEEFSEIFDKTESVDYINNDNIAVEESFFVESAYEEEKTDISINNIEMPIVEKYTEPNNRISEILNQDPPDKWMEKGKCIVKARHGNLGNAITRGNEAAQIVGQKVGEVLSCNIGETTSKICKDNKIKENMQDGRTL